jgi:tripartite-type tricarboxylate transporter receptor subunit TctC
MNRRFALAALAALAAGAIVLPGAAVAEFPERPVTFIVASGAGGGSDTIGRTLAPFLAKHLGGEVVVENKPGAGGAVGTRAVLQSPPDGYTMVQGSLPGIVVQQFSNPDVGYDKDSFDYVGGHAHDTFVIAVLKESPLNNLADLIAYAKENPGEFTCAHPGIGGANHLAALLFMQAADVDLNLVPFAGGGKTRQAMLGGHTMGACMGSVGALRAADEIKILGQSSAERLFSMPDVPTFREQGVDVVAGVSRIVLTPKGVPAATLQELRDALAKAVADPEFIAMAKERGVPYAYISADDLVAEVESQANQWAEMWDKNPWAAE